MSGGTAAAGTATTVIGTTIAGIATGMTAGTTTIGTTTIERRLAGRRLTRRPAPHYSDLVQATVHGRLFRSHSSHTEDTHDHNAAHARLSPFARSSGARRGRPVSWRGGGGVSGF